MQLDDYQQQAVTTTQSRVRVLAGAGSGKTRTLIARAQHLVRAGVDPFGILAVTFSKKAAVEMRERLEASGEAFGVTVSTLHALGWGLLRKHYDGWGVADTGQTRRMVRNALKVAGNAIPFAQALRAVAEAKRRYCEFDVATTYRAYEAERRRNKLFDFQDMLTEAEDLLRRKVATSRWQHILVDEAQDTDWLQWVILRHLVGPDTGLFIVGDVEQAIYGFRGAVPEEMLDGVEVLFGCPFDQYELPCNYRSVSDVVMSANDLMRGEPGALELLAVREEPGELEVWHTTGSVDQAERVVEDIQRRDQDLEHLDRVAILYRTNACAEAFENQLIRANVPYQIMGDWSFYSRAEIRDALSYLRLAQGWDADAADRVMNRPSRYLGEAFRNELERQGGWRAVGDGEPLRFSKSYMERGLQQFVMTVRALQRLYAEKAGAPLPLLDYVLNDVGYRAWLLGEEPSEGDEVKAENLEMLRESVEGQSSVAAVLDLARRCMENQRRQKGKTNAVQLMTVHRAKGLEWPTVYLTCVDAGMLPHKNGDDSEERRIMYVGVTRARDRLVVSSRGLPSPFVQYVRGWHEEAGVGAAAGGADCSGLQAGGARGGGDDSGDGAVADPGAVGIGVGTRESSDEQRNLRGATGRDDDGVPRRMASAG